MCIEDETGVGSGSAELPSYVDLYRPLRQGAYALLFNLNKIQFELKRQAEEEGRAVSPGTAVCVCNLVCSYNGAHMHAHSYSCSFVFLCVCACMLRAWLCG